MRRIKYGIALLFALLLLGLLPLVAFADSPHFISASASVDASGNLVATFKEAGLGTTVETETITLSQTRALRMPVSMGEETTQRLPTRKRCQDR
jgi:hypothetical protein